MTSAALTPHTTADNVRATGRRAVRLVLAFVPMWLCGVGFLWFPLAAALELALGRSTGKPSTVSRLLWVLASVLGISLVANVAAGEVGLGRAAGAALAIVIWVSVGVLALRWTVAGTRPYLVLAMGILAGVQGLVSGAAVALHPSVLSTITTPAYRLAGTAVGETGVAGWLTLDLAYDDYFGEGIVRSAGLMGAAAWSAGFAGLAAVALVLYRKHALALTGRRWLWTVLVAFSLVSVYLSYSRMTYALTVAGIVIIVAGRLVRRALGDLAPLALVPGVLIAVAALVAFPPNLSEELAAQDALRPSSADARLTSYQQGVETVLTGDVVRQVFGFGAKPFSASLGYGVGSESTYTSLLVRAGVLGLAVFLLCLVAAARLCFRRGDWGGGLLLALFATHAIVEDTDVGTLTALAFLVVLATDRAAPDGRSGGEVVGVHARQAEGPVAVEVGDPRRHRERRPAAPLAQHVHEA